jgi:uncharacterized protein YndB with AHSA1/START domain
MTATGQTTVTTQVYRVWIRATPQAIWDAITKPEWTSRYGYRNLAEFDLRPGGAYRAKPGKEMLESSFPVPDVIVDGEVLESDPPHKLVHTWRMLMDPGLMAEGFTTLTYELQPDEHGITKLTVTHELEGAPGNASMVGGDRESSGAGGGWAWVLSELKSLLETGDGFPGF